MSRIRQLTTFLLLGLCLTLTACRDPEPIRIGFIAGLSGRGAGLGTAGRDGFLLAIEQTNAAGGINGRQIIAEVRDTHFDQDTAVQTARELANLSVSAIIGPMLSQAATAIVPEINRARIPTISPTVSTNQLSGRDDFFYRVYYTNAQAARLLAEHLATEKGLTRVAAIYDLGNRAFTEDWVRTFGENLQRLGSTLDRAVPYVASVDTLFSDLAREVMLSEPQAVLILANAVDTALICQQFLKQGRNVPLFATGWSYSDDLFQFGGQSVEGLFLMQSVHMDSSNPEMQAFTSAYRSRFNETPRFQAMHTYDATRMAIAALKQATLPDELRHVLERLDFEGVQTRLAFDPYGDLRSPQLYFSRVEQGRFHRID